MTAFTDLIASTDSRKIVLVHLEPYDTTSPAATVNLFYSSHGYITEPADSPANTVYLPRLKRLFTFRRSLFSAGRLSGRSIPGFGSIVLNNRDGALDALGDYGWGGRRIRVYLGSPDFAITDFGLIFDGTAESIAYGDGEIIIELRDLQYVFDREIQPDTFAGTGAEEGGSDLTDRRKPIALGICREVRMVYLGVNGSPAKHTFFAGEAPIIGVLRVRDLGIELTFNSGTPGPGEWTVDVATGLVTLGGSYNGPITADIIGHRYLSATSTTSWAMATGSKTFTITAGLEIAVGSKVRVGRTSALHSTWGDGLVTAYSGTSLTVNVTSLSSTTGTHTDWTISPWGTVAGLIKEVGDRMGVTSYDTSSFTTLNTAQPATVGYYIPEGGNALRVLDDICNGASCHQGFTRAGLFSVGRLAAPSSPDTAYGEREIIEDTFERQATQEPNYEVNVRYKRIWAGALTGTELAGAVSDADRAYLTHEWRQSKATDAAVITAYPLSEPLVVDSIFDESTDAAAEATRLLALFGVRRSYFVARFKIQPLSLDIGGTTTITYPRYSLDAGTNLRRVEIAEDMNVMETELALWG